MCLGLLKHTRQISLLQKATTGVNSYYRKLLFRRCSSPISITVINEKYSDTNEKKYNAHI